MATDRLVSATAMLFRKFETICVLTDAEKAAVNAMPVQVREIAGGSDVVRTGDRPAQSCLLIDGFAYRYKMLGNGLRQILSFHFPGDIPDLLSLHLPVMDHTLSTIGTSNVGFISHDSIRLLVRDHPRLGAILWRETLIDSAIFREWLAAVGRRNAQARVAHLLCEIVTRMEVVGLAPDRCVQIPITQGAIADALGLTAVHINRVVQGD